MEHQYLMVLKLKIPFFEWGYVYWPVFQKWVITVGFDGMECVTYVTLYHKTLVKSISMVNIGSLHNSSYLKRVSLYPNDTHKWIYCLLVNYNFHTHFGL